ncbi:MAG: SDR family oxidoreductase [Erysipelotrichaceae bacterium]|nr:SDR family oxidoreductase [Erysipelotrichaceae bacterium]
MECFDLSGKVALVSGCSQGLGYACVLTLARAGADIFGISIGDDSRLKKEVEECGRRYHSLHASLTTPGVIDTLIKECLAAYGKIDILLNFAGVVRKKDMETISEADYDAVMDINTKACFFLTQSVIAVMKRQNSGGKIINASSILPVHGSSSFLPFVVSKGAIEAMTKALAAEYAKDDIQVNAISFGYMTTGTSLQTEENGSYDHHILAQIPAERWGCYKDVDGLLLLLASSASNYMTGCIIPIDGGFSIH